ncbi:cryptococcal mannosyltransferase 1-domain-containing protein [Amylostereum chailletii]|nr:cryptococcal mannosyltransferase 1-domain-containing protein [Amylostereum chailletii]
MVPHPVLIFRSRRHLFILIVVSIFLLFLIQWHAQPVAIHKIRTLLRPRRTLAQVQQSAYALVPNRRRPTCTWQPWHDARYASLSGAPKNIFFAMNFYNNEDVLPTFFQEFPLLLQRLGTNRVYVSIYENGSEDNTPELLDEFEDMLRALGVAHTVEAKGRTEYSHKENGHRINVLAAARNAAMAPLYSGAAARHVPGGVIDEVMWINDVFHCQADLLEVIYQKREQGANQACAVDWGGWGDYVVYDRWVLRTMTGRVFYIWEDLVAWMYPPEDMPTTNGRGTLPPLLPYDEADRARFEERLPLQVFSCWNGATVIDAEVFLEPHDVRFRIAGADLDENGVPKTVTEMASECFLSSVDFWKKGFGKILIAPRASVAYNLPNYDTHRADQVLVGHNRSEERIVWTLDPPENVAFQDYAAWNAPERWAPWDSQ